MGCRRKSEFDKLLEEPTGKLADKHGALQWWCDCGWKSHWAVTVGPLVKTVNYHNAVEHGYGV